MTKRKKSCAAAAAENGIAQTTAADKVAGVLALIAIRDMEPDDAALKLDAIGFGSNEISALLGVGPNYVNVARFRRKKVGRTKRKKVD
jgi:hypothetical protein